jgi:hypothetical protein
MSINHVLYPANNEYKWQGDPNKAVTGSGFSVPRGIEAVLSYNNLIMNDLSVYDKYRVMGIDGLGDAEVRDNREPKAGDDGDDAYNNLYSGRTIVIKVRIEAYTLDKLRDMEEALRTAFASMEEKELYFLTGNPEKDHYIKCKKSASLTNTEDIENIGYRHFRDWQITLRASDPRFYRNQIKRLVNVVNIENPELNSSSGMENVGDINAYTSLNDGGLTSAISTDWSSVGTKSLKFSQESMGYETTSKLDCQINSGVTAGESYTISGDVYYDLVGSHTFWSAEFTPYLFYLSSSGNILGWTQGTTRYAFNTDLTFNFSVTGIAPPSTSKLAMQFWTKDRTEHNIYFDQISIRYTNASASFDGVTIINEGNYSLYPKITLVGNLGNISIYNDASPKPYDQIKFKSSVTIAEGNSYIIDGANKTIINSSGTNKISDLDISSGWIKLYPGANNISFGEEVTSSGTQSKIEIEWKDAWI